MLQTLRQLRLQGDHKKIPKSVANTNKLLIRATGGDHAVKQINLVWLLVKNFKLFSIKKQFKFILITIALKLHNFLLTKSLNISHEPSD